jgi:hypothetical protein
MAAGRKDVLDETTGAVVAEGVTEKQAQTIAANLPTSHTVKVKAAAEPESG